MVVILLMILNVFYMNRIAKMYREKNNLEYNGDTWQVQAVVDWYKGAMETRFYHGFFFPLSLFFLMIYVS